MMGLEIMALDGYLFPFEVKVGTEMGLKSV